jgi:hypothetical protein
MNPSDTTDRAPATVWPRILAAFLASTDAGRAGATPERTLRRRLAEATPDRVALPRRSGGSCPRFSPLVATFKAGPPRVADLRLDRSPSSHLKGPEHIHERMRSLHFEGEREE